MIRKIQNINNLEDKINYKFKDINLLEEALTHSSFKNNTESNHDIPPRYEEIDNS